MLAHFNKVMWLAVLFSAACPAAPVNLLEGYGAYACPAGDGSCQPNSRAVAAMQMPNKIVSGRQVESGAEPWVVALARPADGRAVAFCSGSIVAPRWVLTAAHCNVRPGDLAIVGRHDLNTREGREIKVARVVVQPQFDRQTKNNDAALLYLAEAAPAVPVGLNLERDIEASANTELTVAGWGSISYLGPQSPRLLKKDVFTLNISGCKSVYSHLGLTVSDSMFCANSDDGSKRAQSGNQITTDVCQGDGGGGAVRLNPLTNSYQLVGIVSWGVGCGDRAFPGIYTSVSAIADWILQQLQTQ